MRVRVRDIRFYLKIVEELAVAAFVNVHLGDGVSLVKLFIVGHLKHVEINMVRREAPALV